MTRQFNVVVERDAEGFFVATVPSLPGCHTQARSLDQLMERVREAIELYLEVEGLPAASPQRQATALCAAAAGV
jgi:predicted RNase H-like HicB family nuclease